MGQSNLVDNQWTTELTPRSACSAATRSGSRCRSRSTCRATRSTRWGCRSTFRLTESGIGDLRIEGKALLATLGEDEEYTVAVSGRPDAADGQERRAAPTWATRPSRAGSRRSAPWTSARCAPPRNLGHPAARDLEQLRDRDGSPAALRRRGRLPGRAPRRPDAGGVRAQRPEPVHQLLLGREPVRGGHRRPVTRSTACGR